MSMWGTCPKGDVETYVKLWFCNWDDDTYNRDDEFLYFVCFESPTKLEFVFNCVTLLCILYLSMSFYMA